MDKQQETIIPDELICPISRQIFFDPVLAEDGHTYEREQIEKWMLASNNSPITNLPFPGPSLTPVTCLRSIIRNIVSKNPHHYSDMYTCASYHEALKELGSLVAMASEIDSLCSILDSYPAILYNTNMLKVSLLNCPTTQFEKLCDRLGPNLLYVAKKLDLITACKEILNISQSKVGSKFKALQLLVRLNNLGACISVSDMMEAIEKYTSDRISEANISVIQIQSEETKESPPMFTHPAKQEVKQKTEWIKKNKNIDTDLEAIAALTKAHKGVSGSLSPRSNRVFSSIGAPVNVFKEALKKAPHSTRMGVGPLLQTPLLKIISRIKDSKFVSPEDPAKIRLLLRYGSSIHQIDCTTESAASYFASLNGPCKQRISSSLFN